MRFAVVGHYNICTSETNFFFVEIEKLNGEDAITVDDHLETVASINRDGYNTEVVRLVGENDMPDEFLMAEITGILGRRFEFLN